MENPISSITPAVAGVKTPLNTDASQTPICGAHPASTRKIVTNGVATARYGIRAPILNESGRCGN